MIVKEDEAMPSVPAIQRAIVAVLLAREHLPFIGEWCRYHSERGWAIFLYDNTGSVGSTRATSSFVTGKFQRNLTDKRGNAYGKYSESMSDQEARDALINEVSGSGAVVVDWHPTDYAGRIVHGQVEA